MDYLLLCSESHNQRPDGAPYGYRQAVVVVLSRPFTSLLPPIQGGNISLGPDLATTFT
jgi:hypothetical protein